jgi:holliday junction DNA helicase RuvB
MERFVEVEKFEFENEYEQSLRPSAWDEYIGQEKIKKLLEIAIEAAKKRGEVIDHALFFGPPGLGKTTMASLISKRMEANLKVTAAPMIEKSGDLAALLTNLAEGDILFIDEIHRLSSSIEEILYSAMEDFRLDIIIGSGPAAQTVKIDLPRFTLIGATTRAGALSSPLRDRFGMHFRMQFYEVHELNKIVINASKKLNIGCSNEAAQMIAKRSRGTPRIALRLLKRIRDFSNVKNELKISEDTAVEALGELGVNEHGFDEMDIRLLTLLANSGIRATGLNTLSAALNEDSNTIEDVYEPYLLANGYLERTPRGRIATAKTYQVLGLRAHAETLLDLEQTSD